MKDLADSKATTQSLLRNLQSIMGADHVVTDLAERAYFSTDVFFEGAPVDLVLQPGNKDELARGVAAATEASYAVVPRGGGMSYTAGYVPARERSVTIDTRRLNRIVEINPEDMFVTVECGVTWKTLYDALKEKGLRTPYFGPFSGINATVGGTLSQNSIFFGSGVHATAAEAVLGLEVVLADGSIVKTGSGAAKVNPSPFMRMYGPDLSGLFLGDTGALGVKAIATLRLIKFPEVQEHASFAFESDEAMLAAMSEIGRQGLASECYGFDPFLLQLRMKFEGLGKDLQALASVVKSGKSLIGGLKDATKIAMSGRGFMDGVQFAMHVTVEGRDQSDADSAIAKVREIVAMHESREIDNSLPKLVRANPFQPTNRLLGPEGQRWVPIHALVANSRMLPMQREMDRYFEANKAVTEKHSIEHGYLYIAIGATAILVEPTFFWPDSHYELHRRHIEPAHYAKLKQLPANLEARQAMAKIRKDLAQLYVQFGTAHLQIGKLYPYRESREPTTYALLQAIKAYVDPKNLMNPGALGLV